MSDVRRRRIAELKAANLPPLTWRDLFIETPDAPLSEAKRAVLDEYFKQFVATPTNDDGKKVCVCCRCVMRSGIDGALLGGAPGSTTLAWSLVHGKAHCRECGWPYIVYHRDIGGTGGEALIECLDIGLAIHPNLMHLDTGEPSEL